MIYLKNLPLWERLLRLAAGMAALVYAVLGLSGVLGWAVATGGVGMALTGIIGFCPACALAGRRLDKRARLDAR